MKRLLVMLLALAFVATACKSKSKSSSAPSVGVENQKDGADGLKAVFDKLNAALDQKDLKTARELTVSMLPDKESLKKVFKDDVAADTFDAIVAKWADLTADEERAAKLLSPGTGRTEVHVYAATTEELAAYKPGSVANGKFPGGAKRIADTMLRPGVTLYEVEVTEPGKENGQKFHLFFWDGTRWRMMGPAWRAVKGSEQTSEPPPAPPPQ